MRGDDARRRDDEAATHGAHERIEAGHGRDVKRKPAAGSNPHRRAHHIAPGGVTDAVGTLAERGNRRRGGGRRRMAAGGCHGVARRAGVAAGRGRRAGVADVARAARHRRGAGGQAAARVERDEERQVEGAAARPRQEQPDRLARHALRDHAPSPATPGRSEVLAARHQPRRRQGEVEPRAAPGEAARGPPPGRHLRRRLGADRRPASLRLVRLARALRRRLHRQGAVGEVARADADPQRLRRGQLGRHPRRHAGRAVGSRRRRLRHRPRRGDRQGEVAHPARGADDVVDAADRRRTAGKPQAVLSGTNKRRRLRPRDRQAASGRPAARR